MAIRWVSAAWKASLKSSSIERYYLGFRKREYPGLDTSDDTYTLITSADNQAGSHNLTGGHIKSLYTMPTVGTIEVREYSNFAYDTASNQILFGWFVAADKYLMYYYNATDDKYRLEFKDGGTARYLESAAYTALLPTEKWKTHTATWDLGNETGGLWVDRVSKDTSWSGALDTETTVQNTFHIRKDLTTAGDYKINYLRLFDTVTAATASVTNAFRDIENEEIVWYLNGNSIARDRCNISRHVLTCSKTERVANSGGSDVANNFTMTLYSPGGIYADDQYAAFLPASEQFNGTAAQKYLHRRSHVFVENWYGTEFEPIFVGLVDNGGYKRTTPKGGTTTRGRQTVSLTCDDHVAELGMRVKRNGGYWSDYKLADDTDTASLIHAFVKEGLNREVYNFLGNSSFENADITDSWIAAGSVALSKDAAEYFYGSASGQLDFTGAGSLTQTITFDNSKKLNLGETWNWSLFAKSAAGCTFAITLYEYDSAGANDNTAVNCTLAGGEGWKRFNVAHTITDGDSDELRCVIADTANPLTIFVDANMLVQSDVPPNYLVNNTNDGASGTIDAADAGSAEYERIGFDVEQVDITHPWARMEAGDRPWEHIKQISLGVGSKNVGIDQAGTFKLRAYLGEDTDLEPVTVTETMDFKSMPSGFKPNKLVGHGVKIVKTTQLRTVWTGAAVSLWSLAARDGEAVLSSAYFPDTDYPDYWAKYGDV